MRWRLCVCSCSVLLALSPLWAADEDPGQADPAFEFNPAQLADGYIDVFKGWAEQDRGTLPRRDAVLCVGSSSMRMWKDIKADLAPLEIIHRGFGGSTMANVLRFRDFFGRYEAAQVLVYEGDNDLMNAATTPDIFVAQCREFCAAVWARRSDTAIFFITPKPSPSRWSKWPLFQEATSKLRAFCDEDARLTLVDVGPAMLGADGEPKADIFLEDRLHMNRQGYEIWRDVVRATSLVPVQP